MRIIIEYKNNDVFNPTKLWFKDAIHNYLKKELKAGKFANYFKGLHCGLRTDGILNCEMQINYRVE